MKILTVFRKNCRFFSIINKSKKHLHTHIINKRNELFIKYEAVNKIIF